MDGANDLWSDSASYSPGQARELAELLELRAAEPGQMQARRAYLDLLGVAEGDSVLDVGCGTGAVTRDLAARVGSSGRVVGLDPSLGLLDVAKQLADQVGLPAQIEWREGRGEGLPFEDCTFDVVVAVTALAHMPAAERCLPELVRVTRTGGRVGVFDLDGDGVVLAHPDRDLTRRIVAASSDALIVHGWLARRLPGMLRRLGVSVTGVQAFTLLETAPDGFYATMAKRRGDIALAVGAISQEEHRAWLTVVDAERAAGQFLGGQTHLFVWGVRP